MVQYSPFLDKESPLNKALDVAHKAGIGLISMKQSAGQFGGGRGMPTLLQQTATWLERHLPVSPLALAWEGTGKEFSLHRNAVEVLLRTRSSSGELRDAKNEVPVHRCRSPSG